MQGWQTSYLGLRDMPGEHQRVRAAGLFQFQPQCQLELIARRRSDSLKLGSGAAHWLRPHDRTAAEQRARRAGGALLRHLGIANSTSTDA